MDKDLDNDLDDEFSIPYRENRPQMVPVPNEPPPDPVKEQKRKDAHQKKKKKTVPEKESVVSQMVPSMDKRLGLKTEGVAPEEGKPRPKYIVPRTRKQQKRFEQNRANTAKEFCKYQTSALPEVSAKKKVEIKMDIPSPDVSSAKVAPRKTTPSPSFIYPDPPKESELALRKPKSGIFINETEQKDADKDYDSFDLVYSRQARPDRDLSEGRRKKKRKAKGLEDIQERDEEGGDKSKKVKKKITPVVTVPEKEEKKDEKADALEGLNIIEAFMKLEELMTEEGGEEPETYLTKQFRKKVKQISRSTSYQSKDIKVKSSKETVKPTLESKYIQKFRRESEVKRYEPVKRKFKRGTLESHSFTKVHQPTLKDFFFGSKEGSMHQGNENFPESVRNLQGICMPVAAYCFSILKHPNKWTSENIDEILEAGNNLLLQSKKKAHKHHGTKYLRPQDLQQYCEIGDKKVRFTVEDPEVSGYIRSDDQRVFNLSKGLNIFFSRQSAGILSTRDINIAMWRDKYIYMFDARPRTRDLFYSPYGTAIMANFYDVASLATVFLTRSSFGNWSFVIYPLKAYKVLNKDEEEADLNIEQDVRSNYNIINENKAVVNASFELGDKCFEFSRNKQSLAMATVCLVYSRITPPSAWHRSTVDKIMVIGNRLYLECMECDTLTTLGVDSLPAIFTVGPYIVEIYIYANVAADFLYRKCCCMLTTVLEEFFEKSSNAIMQIDNKYHLAVWKQRNMYYCFDPYSRDTEGFICRDGTASVSMHTKLDSLVEVIVKNFSDKDTVFYLHAMKVCKIQRDPVQLTKFPKHMTMDDFPVEDFKKHKMKKSKKPAIDKPVTVDYTSFAMRKLLAGEDPEKSLFEIGSTVESLGMEQLSPVPQKRPSKSVLKKVRLSKTDIIADLDSPSLSDTQIEPPLPQQPKLPEEIDFMDLDSFALTQEEIELQEVDLGEEDGKYKDRRAGGDFGEEEDEAKGEGEEKGEGEGEDQGKELEDWFMTRHGYTQVGRDSLAPCVTKVTEEINTDITYFPINKEILYPTYVRGRQRMKDRLAYPKAIRDDEWDIYIPAEPEVTQSQELLKDTNFKDLPDGTQIICGTKNVSQFGKDIEFIAPFACIMAAVVARKYSISSWTGEIVDYILKCGNELYGASKLRYDQVSKLEIPRITLGTSHFAVLVEYVFDTYSKQNIVELAIEKVLFVRSDMGVMVTPTYACALMYKNHLYYMYDAFGNNEVGLSEGPSNMGAACFTRFKDVHSLANRIMYNKIKRETDEEVVYTRFVLSSVRVKTVHPSQEDTAKRKRKMKKRKGMSQEVEEVEEEEEGEGEDEEQEAKKKRPLKGKPDKDEEEEAEKSDSEEEIVRMEDGRRRIMKRRAENKVGYQNKDGVFVIEGTKQLVGRNTVAEELKEDHFVCICACLMLLTTPVQKWDTKKVDKVLENGKHVFSHAEDLEISVKRTIKNVLIDQHFFDIIVKRLKIENWKDRKTLSIALDTILKRKLAYFLVQFPNACYVIHKSQDGSFHIFDPYGYPTSGKKSNMAGWVQFKDERKMKLGLRKLGGRESYSFYNFEVTSVKPAPKDVVLSSRMEEYDLLFAGKKEKLGKPFYEDVEWLKLDPLPWSRRVTKAANDKERGKVDNMWHNWDIEYTKDLFSLIGNIHQSSEKFSDETRGKQTLANLVTAVGMTEIYDLSEWNSAVVDSILVNGDNYFADCIQDIEEEDYELSMDDLKEDCSIFPFTFKVTFTPVVEGTMFLVRLTQFNLYKALRYFFNQIDRRCGVICTTAGKRKRQVAFGKLQESEYFMFDCESMGPPMFLEKTGKAYVLRTTTLNRLLHVLALTLRGGDFFIFEVEVSDLKPLA